MSLEINHNVQLTLDITSDIYSGIIPCQSYEFFVNGEKVEIDTLHKGNIGMHFRNPRMTLTINVYQVGDITPKHLLNILLKNVEFSATLTKERGGKWEFSNISWNKVYLTSVRGTGMSPDNIPIIACTAKALEITFDGETYGHSLDGSSG